MKTPGLLLLVLTVACSKSVEVGTDSSDFQSDDFEYSSDLTKELAPPIDVPTDTAIGQDMTIVWTDLVAKRALVDRSPITLGNRSCFDEAYANAGGDPDVWRRICVAEGSAPAWIERMNLEVGVTQEGVGLSLSFSDQNADGKADGMRDTRVPELAFAAPTTTMTGRSTG